MVSHARPLIIEPCSQQLIRVMEHHAITSHREKEQGRQERGDVWKSGKWSDVLVDFSSSAAFERSMSILIRHTEQRRRLFAAETVRSGRAAKDAAWKLLL